ncbi:MAG: hypothetical protein QNK37_30970 [Acidobacteriota bacterium]|nr:hypothetical protein [Acidobacteriota bacterium]
MSVAYFITTEDEVDFDTFVNGKAIARAGLDLDRVCRRLGIQEIADFYRQEVEDLGEDVEGLDADDEEETSWFEAEEGLNWALALLDHLEENPGELEQSDSVIEDLKEYVEVLGQLEADGVRWRLEMDL